MVGALGRCTPASSRDPPGKLVAEPSADEREDAHQALWRFDGDQRFYLTPCFYTVDPASLLATSHYHDGLPEIPHEWLAIEYSDEDFNKMADVARSERGVGTLHEATGGEPSRSAKYRVSMQPFGADQEVLAQTSPDGVRSAGDPRPLQRARPERVRR